MSYILYKWWFFCTFCIGILTGLSKWYCSCQQYTRIHIDIRFIYINSRILNSWLATPLDRHSFICRRDPCIISLDIRTSKIILSNVYILSISCIWASPQILLPMDDHSQGIAATSNKYSHNFHDRYV